MAGNDALRKAIKNMTKEPFAEFYGVPCVVDSVDVAVDPATCDCSPINEDAPFLDVRLQAGAGNGVIMIPKVGSVVMVQPINDVTGYVSMYSAIDSIQFLDGSFGGLVKIAVLQSEYAKTKSLIDALTVVISGVPILEPGAGAPSALQAALAAALIGESTGTFANIENTDITHGIP